MTETEKGIHHERKEDRGIHSVGQCADERPREIKEFFSLLSRLTNFTVYFFILFRVRLYHSSPSPSSSSSAAARPRTGPIPTWNQPGNCSVEPTRQPAFALAFAFLLRAISRDPHDLPLSSNSLQFPLFIFPPLLPHLSISVFVVSYVIEGRIAGPDRDLLMILIARKRAHASTRMSNRFSRRAKSRGWYCYPEVNPC